MKIENTNDIKSARRKPINEFHLSRINWKQITILCTSDICSPFNQ